jgi:hypothetical protein
MRKTLIFLILLAFAASLHAQTPITSFPWKYGFEDDSWLTWTQEHVQSTVNWRSATTTAGIDGSPVVTPRSGASMALFQATTLNARTKLVLPKIDLSGLTRPTLSFHHAQLRYSAAYQDELRVLYKTSESAQWDTLKVYTDFIPEWRKEEIVLPNPSSDYYIAFEGRARLGDGVTLDDIAIFDHFDLELIVFYPYTKVPANQLLPSAQVKNVGSAPMTNVELTVVLNDEEVATATVASILPGETKDLTIAKVAVPLGENTVTYTITADQEDLYPENNTATFSFLGTLNTMAHENLYIPLDDENLLRVSPSFLPLFGWTQEMLMGHIFEITETTVLSQVETGLFYNSTNVIYYNIFLYAMTGELSFNSTPVLEAGGYRNSSWARINVPQTTLTPGRYFLCASQISRVDGAGLNILSDGDQSKVYHTAKILNIDRDPYVIEDVLTIGGGRMAGVGDRNYGALAIRMIMDVENCPKPANLEVENIGYVTADFSWEGTLSHYQLIIRDEDRNTTRVYTVLEDNIRITDLTHGTNYTWQMVGLCTSTKIADTVNGEPFVTLTCISPTVNTFPWTFDFEDDAWWSCWEQEPTPLFMLSRWRKYSGLPVITGEARSGQFNAVKVHGFRPTKLVTPRIDFTGVTNPTLEFWFIAPYTFLHIDRIDTLRVFYKTSATGNWELLQVYADVNMAYNTWTKAMFDLSAIATDDFYLAFEAGSDFTLRGVALDEITLSGSFDGIDAAMMEIIQPNSGEELTDAETVRVTVRNNGTGTITSFSVGFSVNSGTPVIETVSGVSVAPGATHTHTFTAKADLSVSGWHSVKAWVLLANDGNPANDTLIKMIVNTVIVDAQVTAIRQPNSGNDLTNAETVRIVVRNNGTSAISSFEVGFSVNNGTAVIETVSGVSVASRDTFVHIFTGKADLSANGLHEIKAWVSLANDRDRTNDTSTRSVMNTVTSSIGKVAPNQPNVVLYPNPTSDKLYIHTSETIKRIEVYNMQGKVVKIVTTNVRELSVANLKAGSYTIRITTDKGFVTQKFVKK